MNLVERMNDELKGKRLSEFEKMRYIYLRCCEIFSYDARWNYYTFFSEQIMREIETRMFDLHNINDTLVICHSFSKSILKPLLDVFTTVKSKVVGEEHSFVEAKCDGKTWNLDATYGDFARVKMGLETEDFNEDEKKEDFTLLDESLGFRHIDKKKYSIHEWRDGYDFMSRVAGTISASDCRHHYTDVLFLYNYMTYLMKQETETVMGSDGYLRRNIHFMENGEDYTISKDTGEYRLALVRKNSYNKDGDWIAKYFR